METISPPEDSGTEEDRRKFRAASAWTGAHEFIPIPFVDDWMINRERRKVVRAVLDQRGLTYEKKVPDLLAGGGKTFLRRLGSFAKGLILKPIKKLFRTVFFWLTAREAARNVVTTYFLARFLQHPALAPAAGGQHLTEEDGKRLAGIFRDVSENIDLRAVGSAVRKVRDLLAKDKRLPTGEVEGTIEHEAPDFAAEFDRMVGERLGAGTV